LRTSLLLALLISHTLLNRRELLQLVGSENRFDLGSPRLADRQDLLLLLLEAHRVVVANGGNLFVFIIYDCSNFLLLIWSELQLIVD
jgi:hypothetical protein